MVRTPLVSPGAELTPAELSRYARQLALPEIGLDGQRRLKAARVLVLGAGGLGAPVLTSLVAAGVGTVAVVDSDTVEPSNLQRQTLFRAADAGRGKAEAAAEALRAQNPLVTVIPLAVRVTAQNVLSLVADYDVLIDGTDNFETRYLAHDAAQYLGKPSVWGSVLRLDGQATVFWAAPPAGSGPGVALRDLFPEQPAGDDRETCAAAGVLGSVCASIGAVMATETLKLIVGFGELALGRLIVHDGADATWREIRFGPRPAAASAASPGSEREPEPGPVRDPSSVSPAELRGLLAARERGETSFVLVDIREPWERRIVAIDGSESVPMSELLSEQAREIIPFDERVILYCHHAVRSGQARDYMAQHGWSDIADLAGGVNAWVEQIEPDRPRY